MLLRFSLASEMSPFYLPPGVTGPAFAAEVWTRGSRPYRLESESVCERCVGMGECVNDD